MKKNAISLLLSVLLCGNALAKDTFWCGYKNYFHISSKSHPGIYISNASADGDVFLQVLSPRSFIIRDTPRCVDGYAHVTLFFNEKNWCVLDIKDGPYMNHPNIHASCYGIEYIGTEYDGWGTHSYTIKVN